MLDLDPALALLIVLLVLISYTLAGLTCWAVVAAFSSSITFVCTNGEVPSLDELEALEGEP